jgi:DNA-binding MarR family transcriptional regulator
MKIDDEISQKKFRNSKQKAVVNILFTSSWLQLRIKDFMKGDDITPQQYNVLKILKGQFPTPVTTSLIRERMLDKMSDVSRIVSRLQEKDLVSVCRSCHDKRLVDIVIADKGIKLIEKIDGDSNYMDNMIGKLSEEEAEQLSTLLDKIRG